MKVLDNLTVSGTISKVGGTATQFLKADGSLDSSVYVTGTPWSGQYLPLAGGIVTGNLNLASFSSLVVTGSLSNYYTGNNTSLMAQSPMTGIWHDLFAFKKAYTVTYENSVDGTNWTSGTLDAKVFAQKQNQNVQIINKVTQVGARWTFSSVSWGSATWLMIGYSYDVTGSTKLVLVESSVDGVAWTTRHTSTYTNNADNVNHYINSYSGDTYLRITITKTDAGVNGAININSLKLMSARPGDQGLGKEYEFPYTWDENQKVTFVDQTTTPKLLIGSGAFLTNSYFRIGQSLNAHIQGNINNTNAGTLASSDWVATANNGTDTTNFINFGINSSANADPAWTMAGANDGYLFTNGGHLTIGTASAAKDIKFFTGGTLAANEKARIFGATGNFSLGNTVDNGYKFDVTGTGRFSGILTLPTPAVDTNTTQAATTAFVLGQASSSNPLMDGSVAIGSSLRYARADHVHQSDTSRAPTASPTFSGTITLPTGSTTAAPIILPNAPLKSTPVNGALERGPDGFLYETHNGIRDKVNTPDISYLSITNCNTIFSNCKPGSVKTYDISSQSAYFPPEPSCSWGMLTSYRSSDTIENGVQQCVCWDGSNASVTYIRSVYNNVWTTWAPILTSNNYNSYSPTLTGTGASGTWGINISGNSATTNNLYGIGGSYITSSTQGTGYDTCIQIREKANGGAQGSAMTAAPRLGFHWSGIVASSIAMETSGRIAIMNNPGNGYENFVAKDISGNSFNGSGSGLTGTASGLSIGGNSATATTATNSSQIGGISSNRVMMKRRTRINTSDSTSLNSSIAQPEMGFTYGGSGEPVGPYIAFGGLNGDIDYSCQLVGAYSGGGNDFKIRTRNDDAASWNSWRTLITDGNYGSYSTFSGAITGASLTVTGDVTAFSDARVKENIRPITNVIERIQASRGVVYDRIDTKQKDNIGFIAQELEETFPELVLTQEDGTKAVKYQNAVAVLFEAIKKQQSQIEDLKALVTKLINK